MIQGKEPGPWGHMAKGFRFEEAENRGCKTETRETWLGRRLPGQSQRPLGQVAALLLWGVATP